MNNKTLIGKNGYLFLTNDSAKELEVHCNNLNMVTPWRLSQYNFDKFLLLIYPDKSVMHKEFLPDEYVCQYRPGLDAYKSSLQTKLVDLYDVLGTNIDNYYKTDTHINFKGNYTAYLHFVSIVNKQFNLNIEPILITISSKQCFLAMLSEGIGDLTWPSNLGEQLLTDTNDTYYYCDDIQPFYNSYKLKADGNIRCLLPSNLDDCTDVLAADGRFIEWKTVSEYILHNKNNTGVSAKVLIFYDSYLLNALPLYLNMFTEVFFSKSIYSPHIIELTSPDYVFEFRAERFLM